MDTGISDLVMPRFTDALDLSTGCAVDGQPVSCDAVSSALEGGGLAQCPDNDCGAKQTNKGLAFFQAFADGYAGYLPQGAKYRGNGKWSFPTPKKNKPTLKSQAGKRTKEEAAKGRAIAAIGIFDNEAEDVGDFLEVKSWRST